MEETMLSLPVILVMLVLGGAYIALKWAGMAREEQRVYIDDLVHRAAQEMTGEPGREKMEFVLRKVEERYPKFPTALARTIAVAAVHRMKQAEAKKQP